MKKINWPRLAVIVWFIAFGTCVWADMPNPINLSNVIIKSKENNMSTSF